MLLSHSTAAAAAAATATQSDGIIQQQNRKDVELCARRRTSTFTHKLASQRTQQLANTSRALSALEAAGLKEYCG
jgi:hypothetical protein